MSPRSPDFKILVLGRVSCRKRHAAMHACAQASEAFLQRMVALFVASHYRNTPNDLLLMADAPAHRLFVLLGPLDETLNALPDVLAVVQVMRCAQGLGAGGMHAIYSGPVLHTLQASGDDRDWPRSYSAFGRRETMQCRVHHHAALL